MRRLVRNTAWSGGATVVAGVLGFLILPYIVAKLGLVGMGLLGIVNIFAISGYVSFFELGFQASITKYTAQYVAAGDHARVDALARTMVMVFLGLGLVLGAAGALLAGFFAGTVFAVPEAEVDALRVALLLMFGSYVFQFPNLALRGLVEGWQRFDVVKGLQTLGAIVHALGTLVLLWLGYGVIALVILLISVQLLDFVVLLVFSSLRLRALDRRGSASLRMVRELWGLSRLLLVGRGASLVFHHTGRILVATMLGAAAVGIYEVVVKFPRLLKSWLGFVNAAIMPAISELAAVDHTAAIRRVFGTGTSFHVFISYPVVLGIMVLAEPLLVVWMGPNFGQYGPLLRIALAYNLLVALIGVGGSLVLGMERLFGRYTVVGVVAAVVNVAAALVLIPQIGLMGVFVAPVLSAVIVLPAHLDIFRLLTGTAFLFAPGLVGRVLLAAAPPLALTLLFMQFAPVATLWGLVTAFGLWSGLHWLLLYLFVLDREARRDLRAALGHLLPVAA
jgi:O-antigen/teichoic acid export membrane protein